MSSSARLVAAPAAAKRRRHARAARRGVSDNDARNAQRPDSPVLPHLGLAPLVHTGNVPGVDGSGDADTPHRRGCGDERRHAGPSVQAQIPDNFCFGCGADNPDGLHLQSHWHDGTRRPPSLRGRPTRRGPAPSSTAGSSPRCSTATGSARASGRRLRSRGATDRLRPAIAVLRDVEACGRVPPSRAARCAGRAHRRNRRGRREHHHGRVRAPRGGQAASPGHGHRRAGARQFRRDGRTARDA